VNPRRLYRCRHDRQLAGVAAGMAEYLDLDPTVVRILWILSAMFGGFTILLYIILAFVIPLEPAPMPSSVPGEMDGTTTWAAETGAWGAGADHGAGAARRGRAGLVLGVLLVVFGTIALAGPLIPGVSLGAALGPAFVLALGVALLVGSARRTAGEP